MINRSLRIALAAASCVGLLASLPTRAQSTVAAGERPVPIERPITVSGRTLLDQQGRPLQIVGDAAWSLIVKLDLESARRYFAYRHAQGFNAVLVNLIEHHFGGPPDVTGAPPFNGAAFRSMNATYFEHARQLVELARRMGFVVFLVPAYTGYECGNQGWCDEMRHLDDATMRAYGRYVGQRFGDLPNVIWVHGGDVDAVRFGLVSRITALAQGIREHSGKQLHTAHCARGLSGLDCYRWLNLDIDSAYGECDTVAQVIRHSYRDSSLPFVLLEARYEGEGEGGSKSCLLRQAYTAWLGGAAGQFYGNGRVWQFNPHWEDVLDTPALRGVLQSRSVLSAAGLLPTVADRGSVIFRGVTYEGDWWRTRTLTGLGGSGMGAYVGSTDPIWVNADGRSAETLVWYDLASAQSLSVPAAQRWLGMRGTRAPYPGDWLLTVGTQPTAPRSQ
jgi:hypothetical protein